MGVKACRDGVGEGADSLYPRRFVGVKRVVCGKQRVCLADADLHLYPVARRGKRRCGKAVLGEPGVDRGYAVRARCGEFRGLCDGTI